MNKVKISISYPPVENKRRKGIPLLAQNRQFQWASSAWTAYPMVPASAATLLKQAGFEVFWDDAINEGLGLEQWERRILEENPDIVVIETKTPVVKKHWQIIDKIKNQKTPSGFAKIKMVLMGDHVTALPEESLKNSQVDYVLTGGDYDFMLLNLANHLTKGEVLEPGWYFRENGEIRDTGPFVLNHDLGSLPLIDRELTHWRQYAYENSNFSRVPGTFTMAGRDCWWRKNGGCSFCSWTTIFPQFRVGKPEKLLDEIGQLIKMGVKEIFDDTGTFPVGPWLEEFCRGMIGRGYNKKICFGCNMRANAIQDQKIYDLMGRAGFRFLLYGLESANQATLDRLNKGENVEDIVSAVTMAKKAGLEPHVTCMVGYPWETKQEAEKTLNLARDLFRRGLIDSLQATIVIPYPGTALFNEAEKQGWLLTEDWDFYDMSRPVLRTEMSAEEISDLVRDFYKAVLTPKFILKRMIGGLSNPRIFFYNLRLARKFFSKIKDFS